MELAKIPPHDIDAEQAVLGSMLTDREAVNAAIEVLKEDDFYREDNKLIYRAILNLYNRAEPVDIITLKSELTSMGKFDAVGGLEYLADLPEKVPTTANEIINLGYDPTEEVENIMDSAEKKIFDIMQSKNQKGYSPIKDVLVDDISQGEITSYTFTDVTANHTLSVIFKEIPRVIAAIKKNVFYANNIYEGYDNFAIGKDGVYLNAIYEDLNEDENIYLDKNGILHVYQFIEDINYGIFNPETDLIDFEYESDGSGSYTLTGWKGTLNGKPSTEMIIPDNENIIL